MIVVKVHFGSIFTTITTIGDIPFSYFSIFIFCSITNYCRPSPIGSTHRYQLWYPDRLSRDFLLYQFFETFLFWFLDFLTLLDTIYQHVWRQAIILLLVSVSFILSLWYRLPSKSLSIWTWSLRTCSSRQSKMHRQVYPCHFFDFSSRITFPINYGFRIRLSCVCWSCHRALKCAVDRHFLPDTRVVMGDLVRFLDMGMSFFVFFTYDTSQNLDGQHPVCEWLYIRHCISILLWS